MFALQMSYFTIGNTTMAVTNAAAAPVGVMCNVTQVSKALTAIIIFCLGLHVTQNRTSMHLIFHMHSHIM